MLLEPVTRPRLDLQNALVFIGSGHDGRGHFLPVSQRVWSGSIPLHSDDLNFYAGINHGTLMEEALGTVWTCPTQDLDTASGSRARRLESKVLATIRSVSGIRRMVKAFDAILLGCAGATFHDDSEYFSESIFLVIWLQDDPVPVDLYFPETGQRIELKKGVWAFFDPCMPHGVVRRGMTTVVDDKKPAPGLPNLAPAAFLSFEYKRSAQAMRALMGSDWAFKNKPLDSISKERPVISNHAIFRVDRRTGSICRA